MCNDACGGYGNRIHAITMSLLFAILSGRIFLIEMTHPFDINTLLHPNAVNWNYANYKHITNTKDVNLIDKDFLKEKWPSFSGELFDPKIKVIKFHTNMGFPWYYEVFDDKWSKMFQDWFNITKDNSIFTYGCVVQYLFTYDKAVTIAIEKEMEELDLIPGLYVSVHFRTFKYCEICSHLNPYKYLNCSLNAANQMTDKSNATFKVYLMTDSEEVAKIASTEYHGKILASHVKGIHVDKNNNDLINGFIGVIVNIEVAAKAAVFVKFDGSTLSDLVHSTGKFKKDSVIILSKVVPIATITNMSD